MARSRNDDASHAPASCRPGRSARRWWLLGAAVLLAAFICCVGPWPVDMGDFRRQPSEAFMGALGGVIAAPAPTSQPSLRAGVGVVEITPPVGEPLAGYSARSPKGSDAIADRLYAKAVTLQTPDAAVTIVGGDILLFLPQLRDAVLARVNLPRREVYFTASHTHSGPGGYSSRSVDQIVLGSFDQRILDRLADQFARAITESRRDLSRAWFSHGWLDPAAPNARNRLDGTAISARIGCICLRGADGKAIATLVSFPAHPTCLGSSSRQASGDYPGVLQDAIQKSSGAPVMFLAGPVGSCGVLATQPRGVEQLHQVADQLLGPTKTLVDCGELWRPAQGPSDWGAEHRLELPGVGTVHMSPPAAGVRLAAGILPIDLPSQQYRISRGWRLSPVLANYLHDRQTYVHVVMIDNLLLLGVPADYSYELAARLESTGDGLHVMVTSFNGDYIGYLLPQSRYDSDSAEARDENLFGPWAGEYMNDRLKLVVARAHAGKLSRP